MGLDQAADSAEIHDVVLPLPHASVHITYLPALPGSAVCTARPERNSVLTIPSFLVFPFCGGLHMSGPLRLRRKFSLTVRAAAFLHCTHHPLGR